MILNSVSHGWIMLNSCRHRFGHVIPYSVGPTHLYGGGGRGTIIVPLLPLFVFID
jgi:hypothetical protein